MVLRAGFHGTVGQSSAQVIDGSLKFDPNLNHQLKRTPSSAGNRKTWTWSSWVKLNSISYQNLFSNLVGNNTGLYVYWNTDGKLYINDYQLSGGANLSTTEVFRDLSSFYHFVVVFDTPQVTPSNRVKLYVNGSQLTLSSTFPNQNLDGQWNNTQTQFIGRQTDNVDVYDLDGSLSNIYFIDGQALTPDSFGFTDPLTNTWRPKKFTGTYGPLVDQSQTWSASTTSSTGSFYNSDYVAAKAFRGVASYDVGYYASTSSGTDTSITVTFSSAYSYSSKIEVYSSTTAHEVSINGGSFASIGTTQGWVTVATGSGSLSTFTIKRPGSGSVIFTGLKIDGKLLVDSGTSITDNSFHFPFDGNSPIGQDKSGNGNDFTPVNFGGSVTLDKATGAKPILNTLPGGTQAGVGVFGSKENKIYVTTTANGSVYQFDITSGDNPSLSFIRGATYKFDYSSHAGHPVLFSSTNPDSSTTAYTTGTSIASNVISFTVPHDAPPTLYYYCSAHPTNMNGAISVTTDETKADKYAANCTLALPLLDVKDDVSNSVNCTSSTKAVTNTGVEFLSESSNFYTGSAKIFDTDKLNVTESNSDFTFGTSTDFTIECWTLITSGHYYGRIIEIGTVNNNAFVVDGNGPGGHTSFRLRFDYTGSTAYSSYGIVLNKWHHVAAVRNSGTLTFYIDGIASGTVDLSSSNLPGGNAQIGNYLGSNLDYDGYMQDLRVYKGVAKYTSDFVVPATSPDILPDTPSGISGSSKLTKITEGGVGGFESTSDYLSLAASSDFEFTGDHTIEMFIYNNTLSGDSVPYATGGSGSSDQLFITASGQIYYAYGQTGNLVSPAGSISIKKWQHLAISKSGTNLRAFVDGKIVVSSSNHSSTIGSSSATAYIGVRGADSSHPVRGFISNFRIVKGSAVYTSEFIPPTAPLTNVTNTKLLCCQSNTSATEGAVKPGTITANADVAATTFNPFITDINTVRGQETGYPTFNPLIVPGGGDSQGSGGSLSDGNLTIKSGGSTGNYLLASCSPAIPLTGKYYFEFTTISAINTDNNTIGIFNPESPVYSSGDYARINPSFSGSFTTTKKRSGTATNLTGSAGDFSGGDVVNIAIDSDNRSIWFGKNGAYYEGNPSLGTGASYTNLTAGVEYVVRSFVYTSGGTEAEGRINFGQKPFKFPPPAGFQPLNDANIRPETVISRPDKFVKANLYTGTGANQRIETGMKPDLIWIKSRNQNTWHNLTDSVRGLNKSLYPNDNGGQTTETDIILSTDSTGFTLGADGNSDGTNIDTKTYVAWTWKAGGNKNTFNIDDVGYANASDVGMNVGGLNSSLFNQSQTWTNSLSISGSWDSGGVVPANAFDGSLATNARAMGQNMQITFDISSSPLTFTDKVEFYHTHFGADVRVNGGTVIGNPPINEFVTIASGGGTLNTITFVNANSKSEVTAIRVDGKLLVDPGINLPTIAASGASVGTKQGFSIIGYTGDGGSSASIPHGLNQKPTFFIVKRTGTGGNDWGVYHSALGATKLLDLNNTGSANTTGSIWNNTEPTSSVFTVGTFDMVNAIDTYIAYLWHDVPGLQKFGQFAGNSSADGVYVELGFKPAILLIKNDNNSGDWIIWDNKRNPTNPVNKQLWPYTNSGTYGAYEQVGSDYPLDFLSSGFKMRTSDADMNNSSRTYIYAAWAEVPTSNLFGASSNAR